MPDEDALYGLALGDFTAERDALARRLRSDGDRDGAARVKALRKPTVAAWAVNQVARTQAKSLRELDAAAGALRDAHAALLQGRAKAAELRAASERERAAVDELVTAASGLLSGRGAGLSESVLQEVRQTLHAVAGDERTRELVLAGRLDRERQAAGLGGELGAIETPKRATREASENAPPAKAAPPRAAKAAARPAKAKREDVEAEARAKHEHDDARARAEELRSARADAKRAAAAARTAEREHVRATAQLDTATAAFAAAKQALADARTTERDARRARDRAAKDAVRLQAGAEAAAHP